MDPADKIHTASGIFVVSLASTASALQDRPAHRPEAIPPARVSTSGFHSSGRLPQRSAAKVSLLNFHISVETLKKPYYLPDFFAFLNRGKPQKINSPIGLHSYRSNFKGNPASLKSAPGFRPHCFGLRSQNGGGSKEKAPPKSVAG